MAARLTEEKKKKLLQITFASEAITPWQKSMALP